MKNGGWYPGFQIFGLGVVGLVAGGCTPKLPLPLEPVGFGVFVGRAGYV